MGRSNYNNCKIKIQDSKIVIGRGDVREIMSHKKDGYYLFSISDIDRSIEQNNTLWMWVDDLREHHGYTKQEMYDALIDAYSWTYTYRDIHGYPKQKKVTTSMMSVSQMNDFMESVVQHAAEEGVILRMPNEPWL